MAEILPKYIQQVQVGGIQEIVLVGGIGLSEHAACSLDVFRSCAG